MNRTVKPGQRCGTVRAPASKSQAHRLLIAAALGKSETTVFCDGFSADILATADCLNALGAHIVCDGDRIKVRPITDLPHGLCKLPCGESGSTLRFLLPVVGALGADTVFERMGRLPERPLEPLASELVAHGMSLRQEGNLLFCSGKLSPGDYTMAGNVSSQYISGLLFALPLLSGNSRLTVTGTVESADYIAMTEDTLEKAHICYRKNQNSYKIAGNGRYDCSLVLTVEGDYSNAAFFLVLGALSERGVTVTGLSHDTKQGDRRIVDLLKRFGAEVLCQDDAVTVRRGSLTGQTVDAAEIPDLIPILSVLAAVSSGRTEIVNAARLRYKESDRLKSTANLLRSLDGKVTETADGLLIDGVSMLAGGIADSFSDHRIAMSAAVAASVCRKTVTVTDADCVRKSYPRFWEVLDGLEGTNL